MSETKYKVGFSLREAKCLNCRRCFRWKKFYDLKEEMIAEIEKHHALIDNLKDEKSRCGKKRLLQIEYVHAVKEIKE